jgi:hypothetical protein
MKTYLTSVLLVLAAMAARGKDYSDCFFPGEVSEYKVSWMGIPLAWSKSTTETVLENGRELIRIRMVAQTYKPYTHIYMVDDFTEVIIDPKTALPLRLQLDLREGGRRKNHLTLFEHANQTAIFIDQETGTTNMVPIKSDTRETLSFLYSVRKEKLEELSQQVHTLLVDGKLYDLGMAIHGDDTIKLSNYGKVACTEVEPLAEFDGLFLRQGKIFFWVSKQNRRMVTCVQAKVPVGKISVKLESVSGPGDDFWVRNEGKHED